MTLQQPTVAMSRAPVARRRADPLLPEWLQGAAAVGWRVLVVVAFGAVVAEAALALSTAVLAILVGSVVAATFAPLVRALRARAGWSNGRAAALTSVLALGAVIVVGLAIVLAFVPYVDDILRAEQVGTDGLVRQLAQLGVPPEVVSVVTRTLSDLQASVPGTAQSLIGPVGTLVTILILGGFLAFYLMKDADRSWASPADGLEDGLADTVTERALVAIAQVGAYLRAFSVTAASSAVSQGLYLAVLGVPLAGPLAVLVFIGGFVPYLGAIFTTLVLLLVTFATSGATPTAILLVLIGLTAFVQRRVLDQRVYSRAVRVHPALVLVVVPAGAALFGIGGLMLAVPLAAAAIAFAPAIAELLGSGSRPEGLSTVVPQWLDRLAQASWRALVVVGVVAVAAQTLVAPLLTAPVVVALVVACAAKPASDHLRRRGLGRTAAALLVTGISAIVVVAVLVLTIVSLATQLPAILDEAAAGGERLIPGLSIGNLANTIEPSLIAASHDVITNVASVFVALVTAAILTFFFLRDGPDWWARLLGHARVERRDQLGESGARAARILNGSTLGTGIVSAIAALLQILLMTVLQLPLAFPVGVLTFFAGFIPYVGGFIASGIVFLVAAAVGGPTTIVLAAILTVVNNILIGNFVAPLVLGRTVNLHPAVVLLAAPVGAAIGGLVGMFLIVPSIAIVAATWRSVVLFFVPAVGGGRSARPARLSPAPDERTAGQPA
jgi:predicted PurR-regulated permease PerM